MTKYYTTSDVAKICNMHRNTIIGSIRSGKLKKYDTPGGHARIAHEDLVAFCREYNLPIDLDHSRNDKILVVDDDPLLTRIIQAGLKKYNYRVEVASNGYDAGFLTLDWKPDCVLLDIMLPDINGDQVAKRIRASSKTATMPIIGISAVTDQSRIDALMQAGANDFIGKPFEVADLVSRIVKLIGKINENVPIVEGHEEEEVVTGAATQTATTRKRSEAP